MAAVPAATVNDGDELVSAVAIMFPRSMMRRGACPALVPEPPRTTLKFTPGVLRDAESPVVTWSAPFGAVVLTAGTGAMGFGATSASSPRRMARW
jgi:hypothetical protein